MNGLAEAYALGLFASLKGAELSECAKEAESLSLLFEDERNWSHLLSSPIAKKGQKELSRKITESLSSPKLKAFVLILGEKTELALLPEALRRFCELSDEQSGVLRGYVYSVSFLDKADLRKIESALSKKLNQTIKLHNVIDSSLLGGIKVAVGGKSYDYTLAGQLKDLRRAMENS